MKTLVLGANGAVGQLVLNDLLEQNHDVTAFVRNASTIQKKHRRLTVVQGDPTNVAELEDVLVGREVVLSTLGARTNKKTTLRADVARNLAVGMKRQGV